MLTTNPHFLERLLRRRMMGFGLAIDDYGMAEGIHGVIGHLVTELVVQGVRGAQRPSYVPSAPRIAVGVK